ncbi:MAG: NAD(P)-binding protein [archaeon]
MCLSISFCGAHTMGQGIIEVLQKYNQQFIVVDFNPAVIKKLIDKKIHCMYGDIGHMEVLEKLNFKQAKIIISTIPELDDNKLLIDKSKNINKKTDILVTANTIDEALELYDEGADYVILPKLISSERIGCYLTQMFTSKKDIEEVRRKEIIFLERKKEEEIIDRFEPDYLKHLQRKITSG